MSKREYFSKFAKEDVKRYEYNEQSLTSELMSIDNKISHLLKKKNANPSNYIKTADSWNKKIQPATLADMQDVVQKYFRFEKMNETTIDKMDIPTENIEIFSNQSNEVSFISAEENTDKNGYSESVCELKNLSDIVLPMETEETIKNWYSESVHELNQQQNRPEQFRRKRAELRTDYWRRLDKLRNGANPTVVNF